MSTATFQQTLTFTTVDCPESGCGVVFAIEGSFQARRREDHKSFYCPNGHRMAYSQDNEKESLRKSLANAQESVARNREWANREYEQRKAADRKAAAARGQTTKMRNRILNGVCPVPGCKRSGFNDVAAHIATVHPQYHLHEDN